MKGKVDDLTFAMAISHGIDMSRGHINKNDGRVRLSVKGRFAGCHERGEALRSRIVWWLNTGEVIKGQGADIHHKNGDRADDRFCNLEKLDRAVHHRYHHPTIEVEKTCINCGSKFMIKRWRLKDASRGRFCGQECYHQYPQSSASQVKKSQTLKDKYANGWRA